MLKVARRLPAIRGLSFRRVPEARLVSQARFQRIERRRAALTVRALSPVDRARTRRLRAEARIAQQLPVLLGLLHHLPRQKAVNKSAKVVAVYVGVEDRIYLISDARAGRRHTESVLAHELTHALDQQNLGTRKPDLSSPFSDASDARFAVREGSAVLTQFRYERRYLGERTRISDRLRDPPPERTRSRLDLYLDEGADFSYRRGARFVRALYRRGGAGLVDRALRHPPVTTASILDPSRWPTQDRALAPAPPVTPGPGWARSYSGTFGAATTAQLLTPGAPGPVTDGLARHWRGGAVDLWQPARAVARRAKPTRATAVTVVRWRWRAPSDATVAGSVIDLYLHSAFGAHQAGPGTWSWPGGGAALASSGSTSTLVVAPTVELAAATATRPLVPGAPGSPGR
ncbi:MAG: hypothetical protein ACJ760_05135 [Thermoleophilaceae bacterium]